MPRYLLSAHLGAMVSEKVTKHRAYFTRLDKALDFYWSIPTSRNPSHHLEWANICHSCKESMDHYGGFIASCC